MPPGGAIASSRSRDHALQQGGKGAGGAANGPPPEVALTELSIDRRELVAVLKRRLQRARRFRTLPLALALLCLYIAAIMARGGAAGDALAFDRDSARGMRLNIASGMAVRFEPGQQRTVELVDYAGERVVYGFRGLVQGKL